MFCNKCLRELNEENFYLNKSNEKMKTCKKCITMHVNVSEPSTFYHILKEVDAPFIPSEWENLVQKYASDPRKSKASSVVGRYLSKMKLAQYAQYSWEDTDRLIEEHNERLRKTKILEDEQRERYSRATTGENGEKIDENGDILEEFPAFDFGFSMPRDEKDRLSLKWGSLYKPEEWRVLENLYSEMHKTFDINGASHEDYLKKICKTSLKMDQAIDVGDIEGFNKLSKSYDMLMKSAKFTALQNKAESDQFIDSIGEMVRLCEAEGFIPRFHSEESQDIVDLTLKDISGYLEKLVKTELNLGSLIESTIKQMQNQAEDDAAEAAGTLDEDVLADDDFLEFSDLLDEEEILHDR